MNFAPYECGHPARMIEPQDCFFCDKPVYLTEPCVMWMGSDTIVFHPRCALQLGVHLIMDARSCEHNPGREVVLGKIFEGDL